MTALVIDDDPMILSLMKRLLHDRGYEVLAYTNPTACPAFTSATCPCPLSNSCPDMIVTDLNMPLANGMDFVKKLKRKGCSCPHIAMVSGAWTESNLKQACELGAQVFAKPLSAARIHSWLDQISQASPTEKPSR